MDLKWDQATDYELQLHVQKLTQLAIRHEYTLNSIKQDMSLFLFVKPGQEGLIPILFAASEKWHQTQPPAQKDAEGAQTQQAPAAQGSRV